MAPDKKMWIGVAVVFLLHFLPYLIFPGNAYIRIHDTLEGEWIWLHVLNETGTAWNFSPDATVAPVMNGLPRSAMPTGLSVMMVSVYLLGTYWGYVANYVLVHIVGFLCMYVLVKKHFIPEAEKRWLVVWVALIFSLIPVYSPFGLSVMGQPLLLYIFLQLYHGKARPVHYILLLLFPLYSSIVWCGIPVLTIAGVLWVYAAVKNKSLHLPFIMGVFVLAVSYALVNYNMFQLSVFAPAGFVSHRTAYNLYMFSGPSLVTAITDFLHQFFTIHYHVGTLLTLPLVIMAFISHKKSIYRILLVIVAVVLFQAGYGFFEYYAGEKIGFIRSFRLNRFNILLPLLWMILFARILQHWYAVEFTRKLIPIAAMCLLFTAAVGNDEVLNNYRRIAGVYHLPVYKEYMAPQQMQDIKAYIGKDPSTYRVACVGMNPSILQYNGFYTLDGLQSVYDLGYKQKFRRIFSNELSKSADLEQYFDGWGNRCCLFMAGLGREWDAFMGKPYNYRMGMVELDAGAFEQLGGAYLISAIDLPLSPGSAFKKVKTFNAQNSYWTLHLYAVKHE